MHVQERVTAPPPFEAVAVTISSYSILWRRSQTGLFSVPLCGRGGVRVPRLPANTWFAASAASHLHTPATVLTACRC